MSGWEHNCNRPPSPYVSAKMAGRLTDHIVWINVTHKPLNYQMLSSFLAKSGCVLFCSRLFFALSVLALARSARSVALHAGILLSHDSPHPLMHSVVWGIHRFPGWLFLELICVCMCTCVLAICMSMSLTQSICYTSSGTNLSNISYDCGAPKFRVIHVYVCLHALSDLTSYCITLTVH